VRARLIDEGGEKMLLSCPREELLQLELLKVNRLQQKGVGRHCASQFDELLFLIYGVDGWVHVSSLLGEKMVFGCTI